MTVFFINNFNKTRYDKKRRPLSGALHDNRLFLRWLLKKTRFHNKNKVYDRLRFQILKEKTYISKREQGLSRVVNRCIFTDTPNSVNKQFRVSRMTFKELVGLRYMTGVTQLPGHK